MPEKTSSRLMQNFRFYLRLSIFSTLFGVLGLTSMWYQADKAFAPTEHQLTTMSMARDNLKAKLALAGKDSVPECAQVATGVYLQSLNFRGCSLFCVSLVTGRYERLNAPRSVSTAVTVSDSSFEPGVSNAPEKRGRGSETI